MGQWLSNSPQVNQLFWDPHPMLLVDDSHALRSNVISVNRIESIYNISYYFFRLNHQFFHQFPLCLNLLYGNFLDHFFQHFAFQQGPRYPRPANSLKASVWFQGLLPYSHFWPFDAKQLGSGTLEKWTNPTSSPLANSSKKAQVQ